MVYLQKRESGLAHIGIILAAILVVAALAFCGWYVWDKNNDKYSSDSQLTDNSIQPTEENQATETDKNTTTVENGKYLIIKEWGVKIPLSDEIDKAYYVLDLQSGGEFARLYDAGMDEQKNADGSRCDGLKAANMYVIGRKLKNTGQDEYDTLHYKQFPFSDEHVFGGLRSHQAPPPCSSLSSGELDQRIVGLGEIKEQEFDQAFKQLQAE